MYELILGARIKFQNKLIKMWVVCRFMYYFFLFHFQSSGVQLFFSNEHKHTFHSIQFNFIENVVMCLPLFYFIFSHFPSLFCAFPFFVPATDTNENYLDVGLFRFVSFFLFSYAYIITFMLLLSSSFLCTHTLSIFSLSISSLSADFCDRTQTFATFAFCIFI